MDSFLKMISFLLIEKKEFIYTKDKFEKFRFSELLLIIGQQQ